MMDRSLDRQAAAILITASSIVVVAILVAVFSTDPDTRVFADNVHWTTGYAGGAALAWLGVRAAAPEERAPRFWFAIALSAYWIGQVLWDVQVASGWNPFPGPSDFFFVLLGPFCGVGLLGFLWRNSSPGQRSTALLDIAGLTAAVLALTLALYLPRQGDTALSTMAVLVLYPVVLCWAGCVGVIAAFTLHLRPRVGWVLFLAALLTNSVLWLRWNSLTLDDALEDGTWFNSLFSVTALAQGFGALHFRAEIARSERWERTCEGLLRMLPLLGVALSSLAVIIVYTFPEVPAAMRWSTLAGALVVVSLASIRQTVLLGERERLIATERSLREQQEAYGMLVEEAADGIFIADARGCYVSVNASGAAMLQMQPHEVVGLYIADIVAEAEQPRVDGEVQKVLAGATLRRPWQFKRKDGSTFPAEVTAKMLPDGRLQGIVRDISERQTLETQLRQAQKLEAIGTLAAGVAHDFNNLLTVIRSHSELAIHSLPADDSVAEHVTGIRASAERGAQLVEQIVAFSRPTPPETTPTSVPALIDEVVGLLRSALPARVEISTAYGESTPIVSADASQLHQVLVNLCTNAWQAMAGRPGTIHISCDRLEKTESEAPACAPGTYARIRVRDDGPGIRREVQERIFEPFFTTKTVGEGTGLGLSVAHSIVRSHGGAISVESALGEGATFLVDLPAATSTRPAEPAGSPATDEEVGDGTGLRVMLVDDEPRIAALMARVLRSRGYQVTFFTSPVEALEHVTKSPESFDVLATDCNMPSMSGLELLEKVRPLRLDAPFIMLSGYVDEQLRQTATVLGIVVEQKPPIFDELCRSIDRVGLRRKIPPAATR
jgi:PAS domain S-box-containing protein